MKHEAWIFGLSTIFFVIVSPAYWLMTGDWTGTSALVMTTLLVAMITLYLGFHASRMEPAARGPQGRRDRRRRRRAGLLPAVLLVAAVVRLHARRDRLRHRAGCLVAGRHRHGPGRPGAQRTRLRVLQGRTRPLSLWLAPLAVSGAHTVRAVAPSSDLGGLVGCGRSRTAAANRFVADAGLRWDGNLYLVRGVLISMSVSRSRLLAAALACGLVTTLVGCNTDELPGAAPEPGCG